MGCGGGSDLNARTCADMSVFSPATPLADKNKIVKLLRSELGNFTCEQWSFRRRLRRPTWSPARPNGDTLDDPVGPEWAVAVRRKSGGVAGQVHGNHVTEIGGVADNSAGRRLLLVFALDGNLLLLGRRCFGFVAVGAVGRAGGADTADAGLSAAAHLRRLHRVGRSSSAAGVHGSVVGSVHVGRHGRSASAARAPSAGLVHVVARPVESGRRCRHVVLAVIWVVHHAVTVGHVAVGGHLVMVVVMRVHVALTAVVESALLPAYRVQPAGSRLLAEHHRVVVHVMPAALVAVLILMMADGLPAGRLLLDESALSARPAGSSSGATHRVLVLWLTLQYYD